MSNLSAGAVNARETAIERAVVSILGEDALDADGGERR